jgi:N-acetyl-alpha-D-glucosaminyl L-malate synthase BshA
MRLAIVCYPTYGGSGVVASELAIHLAERGHSIHVVSYEQPFRLDRPMQNLSFHSVQSSDYPLFRYPHYTLNLSNKLIELVEDHGVEIIHSHYAIPHAVAAWQAREVLRDCSRAGSDRFTRENGGCRQPVKLACTLHGTDITLVGRERAYYEMTRFAIKQQDLITAPSAWLAAETDRYFGTEPGAIRAIPNFVDLTRFAPDPAQPWRATLAPEGYRVITHVSNFRPVKRIEEVVGAFAALRRRMPAVLALVGDGPELPKAEHLARELGLREDVRMLGLQRPEPILQASDLFLLPSRSESFGLSALEAMACGVPVLGYSSGGLPEVVEDGVSGILCPEGSDICLGTLAANLLEDQPRYQAMRVAARRRAEQFAPGPVVDRYERELLALLTVGKAQAAATEKAR